MTDKDQDPGYDRFDELLDTDPIELRNEARLLHRQLSSASASLNLAERRIREAMLILDLIHESDTTVWTELIRKALTDG